MPVALKVGFCLILAAILAFCCFGFLASAEAGPQGAGTFRLLYGSGILASIAGLAAVGLVRRKK